MNKKDRQKIMRIFSALAAVPGAQDGFGAASASAKGLATFHRDIEPVRDACGKALFALACPDPDLDDSEREADFEATMKRTEVFIERRSAANWN